MSFFGTTDFFIEVAKGNIAGHSFKAFVARSKNIVSASAIDIWGGSANFVQPTANETWQIRSTSADDTSAGTGARLVLVNYLDEDYVVKSTVATMNGTSAVTLLTDHFMPDSAVVISSGSGLKNAGDIIIEDAGGGNNLRQFIETGFSASQDVIFAVPAGFTAFIIRQSPYFEKNESGTISGFAFSPSLNTEFTGGMFPAYQNTFDIEFEAPFLVAEKTHVSVRAISDNSGPINVSFVYELLYVDNNFL